MNQTPKLIDICVTPEFVQGTTQISKAASLMSGFPASVYGDPEESRDIAVVLDMTEVMDVTRWCAVEEVGAVVCLQKETEMALAISSCGRTELQHP